MVRILLFLGVSKISEIRRIIRLKIRNPAAKKSAMLITNDDATVRNSAGYLTSLSSICDVIVAVRLFPRACVLKKEERQKCDISGALFFHFLRGVGGHFLTWISSSVEIEGQEVQNHYLQIMCIGRGCPNSSHGL